MYLLRFLLHMVFPMATLKKKVTYNCVALSRKMPAPFDQQLKIYNNYSVIIPKVDFLSSKPINSKNRIMIIILI